MKTCRFDALNCHDGIEALKLYRREWDTDKKCFKDSPLHDWTSHPADGYRYMAMSWSELYIPPKEKEPDRNINDMSLDELYNLQSNTEQNYRI